MSRRTIAALAVLTLAGGCASVPPEISRPELSIFPPRPINVQDPAPATPVVTMCDMSYRPHGLPAPTQLPAGSPMAVIHDRGYLNVGIGTGGNLLTFQDPTTGKVLGFEAGIVQRIARAIFGDDDPGRIRYRTLNADERVPTIEREEVDMVLAAMTMTCERAEKIDFSANYYTAGQRILVNRDSEIKGSADLGGKKVCASNAGTNIPFIQSLPTRPIAVSARNTADCLLMLQQRQVDAILTGDVIMAGLAAQDPGSKMLDERLSSEPTGVGISKKARELTRFVNAILEQLKSDGTWAKLQGDWLAPVLGPASPPDARYLPE
jgi:polar amino acid transport system substrate-binding protein